MGAGPEARRYAGSARVQQELAMVGRKEHVIEAHIPSLRRYARALLRDADRADDLVHDCLERALGRWHLWRSDGDLRAWLFTIMHNLYVNALRRDALRRARASTEAMLRFSTEAPAQDDRLYLRSLAAALDEIPADQREVVLLVGLEGFSYREVAGIIGVPIGTVMSRLSRGREKLREIIGEKDAPTIRRIK